MRGRKRKGKITNTGKGRIFFIRKAEHKWWTKHILLQYSIVFYSFSSFFFLSTITFSPFRIVRFHIYVHFVCVLMHVYRFSVLISICRSHFLVNWVMRMLEHPPTSMHFHHQSRWGNQPCSHHPCHLLYHRTFRCVAWISRFYLCAVCDCVDRQW